MASGFCPFCGKPLRKATFFYGFLCACGYSRLLADPPVGLKVAWRSWPESTGIRLVGSVLSNDGGMAIVAWEKNAINLEYTAGIDRETLNKFPEWRVYDEKVRS